MANVNGFTHEDDVLLIDLIRKNRELYDVNHKMHKDIALKYRIWNEISTVMEKSAYQCKRRWKNIKIFYLKSKSNMETGSSANNDWPLSSYVSFLDENMCEQNIQNGEAQSELGEQIFDTLLHNDGSALPSSSAEISAETKENKIAVILAEGLKERNEILYNSLQKQIEILDNTSFTVTIQYEQKSTSNVQSEESKNEHGNLVADDTTEVGEFIMPQQLLSPNTVSCYLAEKLAQSKERNTILHNLQKQIEMLNNKSETTKSLDFFFKSVLLDIQDFGPRAIYDIKRRILNCVSEVREVYQNSNVSPDNLSSSNDEAYGGTFLDERNTVLYNLHKQIEMLNSKLDVTKTMDLFFKSVSADIEDFCIRAIDDVKLKILECVSEVKEIYFIPEVSPVTSLINDDTAANYVPPPTPPINYNLPRTPPGFITYFNVPLFCNDPPNYEHPYY